MGRRWIDGGLGMCLLKECYGERMSDARWKKERSAMISLHFLHARWQSGNQEGKGKHVMNCSLIAGYILRALQAISSFMLIAKPVQPRRHENAQLFLYIQVSEEKYPVMKHLPRFEIAPN